MQARVAHLRRLCPIIKEVEVNVKSTVSKQKKESLNRVSAYKSFSNAHTDYEEANLELRELKEIGSSKYLELLATRNIELSSLRHEANLRKLILKNYEVEHFPWRAAFQKLREFKESGEVSRFVNEMEQVTYLFHVLTSVKP